MLRFNLIEDRSNIERCFDVMRQLRTTFSSSEFVSQVLLQQKAGYQLLVAENTSQVVGVAGFVITTKLAWGKHLYVDDLVTDPQFRSSGVGAGLISWLKNYAIEQACEELHLDSGVQRFSAHKFYLRENFEITSHHFALKL